MADSIEAWERREAELREELDRLHPRVAELAHHEKEMLDALHRLPEPPKSMGDGPDERVTHALGKIERLRAELDEANRRADNNLSVSNEANAHLALAHEALRKIAGPCPFLGVEAKPCGRCNACIASAALSAPAMQRAAELEAARKRSVSKFQRIRDQLRSRYFKADLEYVREAVDDALAELAKKPTGAPLHDPAGGARGG